jgi:SAM-dependent methyltransferase
VSVAALFDAAFHNVASGRTAAFTVRHPAGGLHRFEPEQWCREALAGDAALLAPCAGPQPTLDVGCGPGRLTAALALGGTPTLGIDLSPAAVRLARARGAMALCRDVFGPLPGAGRWQHLLLADGNVGIGGDPARLLARCRGLLAPGGRIHAELAPPGTPSWSGRTSVTGSAALLPWAVLAVDDLAAPAAAARLRVRDTRTEAGRWFATLTTR